MNFSAMERRGDPYYDFFTHKKEKMTEKLLSTKANDKLNTPA